MSGEMNGSVTPEVEARQLGWVPKEDFRGDPERWVDAEAFVQRGHDVMPILKANNARLVGDVARLSGSVEELKRLHAEALETIQGLKTFSAEMTATKVKEAKAGILAQLKAAKESGDADAEVRLTDELTDLKVVEREQKTAAAAPAPAVAKPVEGVDPVFTAWAQQPENAWFGSDRRKTALAIEVARELREDPANKSLIGVPFFDKVADEVAKAFGSKEERGTSKVEGSRGGSGGSGGGGPRGKSYADLPAEAKAACDKQGKSFVGKPGYKTEADWRTFYCTHYFAGEE